MHLQRFVARHPTSSTGNPPLGAATAGVLISLALLAVGLTLAMVGLSGGEAISTVLGLSCGAVGCLMLPAHAKQLAAVLRLRRQGRACYAIADSELILVDAEGNAVIVALDRIIALGLHDGEIRLRTDSELQNVVYSILYRLFDDEAPAPSPSHFVEALAPRLRSCCPHADIDLPDEDDDSLLPQEDSLFPQEDSLLT